MTDAPEKIWADKEFGSDDWDAGTFCTVSDGGTEYTRTDIADALIEELSYIKANYYLQPKPKMQSGQWNWKGEET